MIINISANLTEEQALILAKEKGYSETVTKFIPSETPSESPMPQGTTVSEPNLESPFVFLKRVYEAMIVSDAQRHFIERDRRINVEARQLAEEQIKNAVIASISSSIE